MKGIAIGFSVLAIAASGGSIGYTVSTHNAMKHTLTSQEHVIAAQNKKLTWQKHALTSDDKAMKLAISKLRKDVVSVNAPTDPLSAYDQICNTSATNSSTGRTETYYYPCTNQATTIPQPGY